MDVKDFLEVLKRLKETGVPTYIAVVGSFLLLLALVGAIRGGIDIVMPPERQPGAGILGIWLIAIAVTVSILGEMKPSRQIWFALIIVVLVTIALSIVIYTIVRLPTPTPTPLPTTLLIATSTPMPTSTPTSMPTSAPTLAPLLTPTRTPLVVTH